MDDFASLPPPSPSIREADRWPTSEIRSSFPSTLRGSLRFEKSFQNLGFELIFRCGPKRRNPSQMIRGIGGRAGGITCQPYNRATIVRRNPMLSLQLPKKLPASEFWQVLHPPAAHGRPRCHCWWKFPGLPNMCDWSFRPAQNISGLPPIMEVGWGGGAQHRSTREPWRVFHIRHLFQTC